MSTRKVQLPALLSLCALLAAVPAAAQTAAPRAVDCYVVVKEGASAEGTQLYLRNMLLEPEMLRTFAPARFTLSGGRFSLAAAAGFSYEAEGPTLVQRSGDYGLYTARAKVRGPAGPWLAKSVAVELKMADLVGPGGEIAQPGLRAIEMAASKTGWPSGLAWVESMSLQRSGSLRVVVRLSR